MRALSATPETLVLGYANDASGYLVTDKTHDELGYEAGRTMFKPGVEALLTDAAQQALRYVDCAAACAEQGY